MERTADGWLPSALSGGYAGRERGGACEEGLGRGVGGEQVGGWRRGKVTKGAVVDATLKFPGRDNVFVGDGSVVRTSLGVNPQESIMGISRWASQFVAAAV